MWWGKSPSICYLIHLSISSSFMDNQILSFLLNVPYIPFFTFLLLQNLTTSCSDSCNSLLLFHSDLFFLVILNTLSRLIVIKACHSYILLRNPDLCNTSELFRLIYDLLLTNPTFQLINLYCAHDSILNWNSSCPSFIGFPLSRISQDRRRGQAVLVFGWENLQLQMRWMEMFPEQTRKQKLGNLKKYCNLFLGLFLGPYTPKVILSP